jgi:hypothetical protein
MQSMLSDFIACVLQCASPWTKAKPLAAFNLRALLHFIGAVGMKPIAWRGALTGGMYFERFLRALDALGQDGS